MDAIKNLFTLVDEWSDYTISIRRQIHAHPELAFHEFETSALVARELDKLGIPYEQSAARPGLIATLDSGRPGKLLMLRADMDALPIDELAPVPFRSQNAGVMHACGHDVHTANLLTVGAVLNQMKDTWRGRVKLVFQPAEERGGGGREMIRAGLLDEVPDACLGFHVQPVQRGRIIIGSGYRTAYSDSCTIRIHGKAVHSSKPQDGVDAILIASHIVQAIHTIVSRNIDPELCSTINVGMIRGGHAPNIIPDEVELVCMMRNAEPEPRQTMFHRLQEICQGVAAAFGGSCEVEITEGYPAVYNNPSPTAFLRQVVESYKEPLFRGLPEGMPEDYLVTDFPQQMTSEDFGFYAQKVPSCFVLVGTGNYAPAHNQFFQVDDQYIKLLTRTAALAAFEFLK